MISISTGTILKLVGVLLVAVFLYAIRDILLIFSSRLSLHLPWIRGLIKSSERDFRVH